LIGVPHTTCSERIIKQFHLYLDSLTISTSGCALSLLTLEFSNSTSINAKEDQLLNSFHNDSAAFTRATQDDFSFFDDDDDDKPEGSTTLKAASNQKQDNTSLSVDMRKYDFVHEIRVWRERTARDGNRWHGTIQVKR